MAFSFWAGSARLIKSPQLLHHYKDLAVLAYHYGLEHKHRHFALHAYHERFSGPYHHGFSFLKPVYDRGQFQAGNGLRRVVQVLRDLKQTSRATSDGTILRR